MALIIKNKCKDVVKYLVYVPVIECYLEFKNLNDAKLIARQVKRMI